MGDDLTFFWFWLLANAEDLRNAALVVALLSVPPFVVWRAWLNREAERRAARRSLAEEQARDNERLTQLFAQLGSEQVTMRIAAVHTLEQMAREHPRHHGPIMQTLSAFVREQIKAPAPRLVGNRYESPDPSEIYAPPRVDIQAAVSVIGRRERLHDRKIDRPMLAGVNLSGYDLSNGDFTGANFRGSYLCGAVLSGARLEAARFDYAVLERADLFGAECMGASFMGAAAPGARFAHARLEGANFVEADLRSADFTRARLDGANLDGSNFDGAVMDEVSGLLPAPMVEVVPPALEFRSTRARV